MNRLLITGASGFIGRQIFACLPADRWQVHAASRGDRDRAGIAPDVTWHDADLRDAAQATTLVDQIRPSHLLHLAWNTDHGRYWTAGDNEQWADATVALARAFIAHRGQRFVGIGTCAEYDWRTLDGPCREDTTPLQPHTAYGQAKLRAWRGIETALAGSQTTAAWGRLFLLYGPGEHPGRLVPSVIASLASGQNAKVTAGTQVRDFLHVADVAGALVALLESPNSGAVNIGSGEGVTLRTLVETLARLAGHPDRVEFGAVPMRADDPQYLVANIDRLHATGWRQRISLETGLRDTVNRSL